MNGHQHNQEHQLIDGINYITSGKGCDVADALGPDFPGSGLLFNSSAGGFGVMTVTDAHMSFKFIDEAGAIIYNATVA